MKHKIVDVLQDSVAAELEIEKGDVLLAVNGQEIEDVFDFRMLTSDESFTLLIEKTNGEEWEVEIEKDPEEELGLIFESDLMSNYRHCSNNCIFCFVDQMPEGMRDTLYFKDDDSRLSFLQGNYITLTNMSEKEIDRMIHYHLEPLNISVHTTNPELRKEMLHNRFAGDVLRYLDKFYEAGLHMNAQIVLCKEHNDGEELERTLSDLYKYLPVLESLSIVPVGLTKYRDHLPKLKPIERADAISVIQTVEKWQKKAYAEYGLHFVHASDEFYITAGLPFPEEETYDNYLQLENGVGMARLLLEDSKCHLTGDAFREELKQVVSQNMPKFALKQITLATGVLAAPILNAVKDLFSNTVNEMIEKKLLPPDTWKKLPNISIQTIENDFFGHTVTVAGLLTGQDVQKQLQKATQSDLIILPNVMFKSGEEVFLDDMTRTELETALKTPVCIAKTDAYNLIHFMEGAFSEDDFDLTHGVYELPSL